MSTILSMLSWFLALCVCFLFSAPIKMDEIEIVGRFTYEREDMPGEMDPTKTVVHLDSFFRDSTPLVVSHYSNDKKNKTVVPFTIRGNVPQQAPLPRDARIVFHSWESTKNEYDIVCLEDCGLTSAYLPTEVLNYPPAGWRGREAGSSLEPA